MADVDVELHPSAALDAAAREASLRELRRLVYDFKHRDPEARRVALELHGRLHGVTSSAFGGRVLDLDTGSSRAAAIGEELLRAGELGTLILRRRVIRSVVLPIEILDPEPVLGPEDEPTAWIAIELVDDEGNPVPNAAYRIVCDDGRVRTGTTNLDGKAREEGLHDGSCKVYFPALNPPDWKKVG